MTRVRGASFMRMSAADLLDGFSSQGSEADSLEPAPDPLDIFDGDDGGAGAVRHDQIVLAQYSDPACTVPYEDQVDMYTAGTT